MEAALLILGGVLLVAHLASTREQREAGRAWAAQYNRYFMAIMILGTGLLAFALFS